MTVFSTALIIAARSDLDNPGCYRTSLDYFRLFLEVVSLFLFLMKGVDEIREIIMYAPLPDYLAYYYVKN